MGSKLNVGTICLMFLLAWIAAPSSATVFNVNGFGAKAGGQTDISQALSNAWKAACAAAGTNTVLIPKDMYLLGPVVLGGPCKGTTIGFQIEGVVKAPEEPSVFKTDFWIEFLSINGLTISGGGTFDGQGQKAWANCANNPNCPQRPTNIKFTFLNNGLVRDITSLNSKMFHINFLECKNINLQHITIRAPQNSKNTDGIHIQRSSGINVTDAVIGTGDDCISIGEGSRNVHITKVVCGPGHGLSIGSLGKVQNEQDVAAITVRNCTLTGTTNGVRIKTWPSSPPGLASNIDFEDIIVNNVFNPIIVDQAYCPNNNCNNQAPSRVKLSNVKFNNIRGTSASQIAVVIACSKAVPCENLQLGNINLEYHGGKGPATSVCSNVKPVFFGKQIPPTCV